jgi:integrase
MARRKQRRGYNPKARYAHKGVTIAEEVRAGRKVVLLRWREPMPGGRVGKRRGCYAMLLKNGRVSETPAASRTAAEAHAALKAAELKGERERLRCAEESEERRPDAGWTELKKEHAEYLVRKGRATKSRAAYNYAWSFVESWPGRPAFPAKLTLRGLESLAAHLAQRGLSEASQASVMGHLRVILNFGRDRIGCVRLGEKTIKQGLEPPKADLVVSVRSTKHLRQILTAALKWDKEHPEARTFHLLAFLMLSGCRRGEAERLRWEPSAPGAKESWVDLEGDRLLIYGVKTRVQRPVPLTNRPALRRLLDTMRAAVDSVAEPFVFGGALPLAVADKRAESGEGENKLKGRSLKRALAVVRANSGANWSLKSLRSTFATFMANSGLYGADLYTLANENGHRYEVLVAKYATGYSLPAKQKAARTVEEVLGVRDMVDGWCKAQARMGGKIIRLRA